MKFFLQKVVLSCLLIVASGLEAIYLNDENFEPTTKAGAGTHQDEWLILFCEIDRFKRCRDLLPFWNELANVLDTRTKVAIVNV